MKIHLSRRISWFALLAALIVLNILFGQRLGDDTKQMIFVLLIVVLAISTIALLVLDRFTRSDTSKGTDDLAKVQRAMEEEFKNR